MTIRMTFGASKMNEVGKQRCKGWYEVLKEQKGSCRRCRYNAGVLIWMQGGTSRPVGLYELHSIIAKLNQQKVQLLINYFRIGMAPAGHWEQIKCLKGSINVKVHMAQDTEIMAQS